MIHLIDSYYDAELPEGAAVGEIQFLVQSWLMSSNSGFAPIPLPDGKWKIAFTRDTQTEEGWKEIVDSWESVSGDGTPIYENYKNGGTIPKCRTAEKSGETLLESKGIDPKKNFVIIKKM